MKEMCTTTYTRKQRSKPQKGNRIVEYESRIKRLESLLHERNVTQPHVRQQPIMNVTEPSIPLSTWVESLRHEVETGPQPQLPDFNPFDLESILHSNDAVFADNLGALSMRDNSHGSLASNPSLTISLDGIQPSVDFQDDAAFLQSGHFGPRSTSDLSPLPPPIPRSPDGDWYLPPPELGTSLLAEYLTDLNTAYPLYQPHVIADHLRTCYAGLSDGSAVAWTSAYIVFGLAHYLRGMSVTGTSHDMIMAPYYLARAYSTLNTLLAAPPSLGQVQCLIGLALLMVASPCSYKQSAGHFVSTALRVIRTLVYEDEKDCTTIEALANSAHQRRVFWICFINDITLAILNNTQPTHQLQDVANCSDFVADELGALTAAEGTWRVLIFWLFTRIALLQTEAIDQVLSRETCNTTPMDLSAATSIIFARLQAFREQHHIFHLSASQIQQLLYRADICHCVALEAYYFATIYRLHAFAAMDMSSKINPFDLGGLDKMSKMKQQKSYQEARRLLSLLPIAPRGSVALYWMIHSILIAAFVTIIAHHIQNQAAEPLSPVEFRIYQRLVADLDIMVAAGDNANLAEKTMFCKRLLSTYEARFRAQTIGGTPRSIAVTS
ncbi:hypothetical protein G6011_11525 [Alternaria panax]|uniref:Transcription factor domain-containing protein n=1 Tax=Alternaria panax TaxID=48097 RepID=A0AAD4IDL0_9PLEO|nr:hypothetical protein G6011_11525 [Alternaria panax]